MGIELSGPIVAILAHPDDIKSVTGIALRAIARHLPFSLILVTKGEALTSTARAGLAPREMGQLRVEELHRYLGLVGISEEALFVIGIPDGSATLPALRDDFYRQEGDPYLDPLLLTDRVLYDDVYRPGLLFYGEALLAALQELVAALKPETILTHHPQDDHADHRAVSFFARQACPGLHGSGRLDSLPSICAPLVYYRRCTWPPEGDHFFVDEIKDRFPRLKAVQFCLTEHELAAKRRASAVFAPTLSVAYIESNMKRDEVLWCLPDHD
jgi:LmbE family N-acetylglucosaminyl deacetylase